MENMKSCIIFAVIGVVAACLVMVVMGMFHPAIAACMAGIAVVELAVVALGAGNTKKTSAEYTKTQTV